MGGSEEALAGVVAEAEDVAPCPPKAKVGCGAEEAAVEVGWGKSDGVDLAGGGGILPNKDGAGAEDDWVLGGCPRLKPWNGWVAPPFGALWFDASAEGCAGWPNPENPGCAVLGGPKRPGPDCAG